MSDRECHCGDPVQHAKAVESSIFGALTNAMSQPERETYWRHKADMLERKFTTGHGRHLLPLSLLGHPMTLPAHVWIG